MFGQVTFEVDLSQLLDGHEKKGNFTKLKFPLTFQDCTENVTALSIQLHWVVYFYFKNISYYLYYYLHNLGL